MSLIIIMAPASGQADASGEGVGNPRANAVTQNGNGQTGASLAGVGNPRANVVSQTGASGSAPSTSRNPGASLPETASQGAGNAKVDDIKKMIEKILKGDYKHAKDDSDVDKFWPAGVTLNTRKLIKGIGRELATVKAKKPRDYEKYMKKNMKGILTKNGLSNGKDIIEHVLSLQNIRLSNTSIIEGLTRRNYTNETMESLVKKIRDVIYESPSNTLKNRIEKYNFLKSNIKKKIKPQIKFKEITRGSYIKFVLIISACIYYDPVNMTAIRVLNQTIQSIGEGESSNVVNIGINLSTKNKLPTNKRKPLRIINQTIQSSGEGESSGVVNKNKMRQTRKKEQPLRIINQTIQSSGEGESSGVVNWDTNNYKKISNEYIKNIANGSITKNTAINKVAGNKRLTRTQKEKLIRRIQIGKNTARNQTTKVNYPRRQFFNEGEALIRGPARNVNITENPPAAPPAASSHPMQTQTEDPPRPQPKIQPWQGMLAKISTAVLAALSVAAATKAKAAKAEAKARKAVKEANAANNKARESNSAKAAKEAAKAAKAAKAAEEIAKKAAREAAEAAEAAKAAKAAEEVAKNNPQLSLRSIFKAIGNGFRYGVKKRVYNQFSQVENKLRKG